jgi:signal transduction histidine kinase
VREADDPATDSGAPPAGAAGGVDLPWFLEPRRGWPRALVWFALWTALGLLQAARLYFVYYSDGVQLISWPQALTWALADWYLWGLASLIILPITRRTPFARTSWPRDLAVHTISAPLIGAVQLAVYAAVYRPLGTWFEHQVGASHTLTYLQLYEDLLRSKLHGAVLTYFLIAFVAFTFRYARQYHAAEQRRRDLETRLVRAQLDALKMQLHPHFLFNTLNAITSLIHSDPDAADRMTTHLAGLLRAALDSEAVQEVPLRHELNFLEGYLEIQRIRFGDRLRIAMEIAPDTRDALVPNLILQPLVENAVQHGVAPASVGGTITVRSRRDHGRLCLEVCDDGPGLRPGSSPTESGGRGVANTRERLRQLYGDAQSFSLGPNGDAGLRAVLTLPCRTAPDQIAPS